MWDFFFSFDNPLQITFKALKGSILVLQLINLIFASAILYANLFKYCFVIFHVLTIAGIAVVIYFQKTRFRKNPERQYTSEIIYSAGTLLVAVFFFGFSTSKSRIVHSEEAKNYYDENKAYYIFSGGFQFFISVLQGCALYVFRREQIRYPPFKPGIGINVTSDNVKQIRDKYYFWTKKDYGDDDDASVDLGLPSTSSEQKESSDTSGLKFADLKVRFRKREHGDTTKVDVHTTEQEGASADSPRVDPSDNTGSSPAVAQESDTNLNLIAEENDNLGSSPDQEDTNAESPPTAASTPTEVNIPLESHENESSAEIHVEEDVSSDVLNDPT